MSDSCFATARERLRELADGPIVSGGPASFQLPDAERAGEKAHALFELIVGSDVRT